jgi:Protein of unknown function (DUF2865)
LISRIFSENRENTFRKTCCVYALMRGCVMVVRLLKSERRSSRSASSALVRYAATLTLVVGATLGGGAVVWDAIMDAPGGVPQITAADGVLRTESAVLESGDDWNQSLRSEKFWARKSSSTGGTTAAKPDFSQRSGLIKTSVPTSTPTPAAVPRASSASAKSTPSKSERADASDWYSGDGGNYRTVCVRLCDGYFWPISFSTESDNFDRDKRTCEKSCGGAQTRLFTHENPGQDVEQMVDLKGVPYTKLRTAFLFRTSYDQSCKCNAHPWEQASLDRHRIYALEADKRKGSQTAAAELTRMKSALLEARKSATAVRTASVEMGRLGNASAAPGIKRVEAPVPVVIAGHKPMSGSLPEAMAAPDTSLMDTLLVDTSLMAVPVAGLAAAQAIAPASEPAAPLNRLQQWAQMVPTTMPLAGSTASSGVGTPVNSSAGGKPQVVSDQVVSDQTGTRLASSDLAVTLPVAPFALANSAPFVGSPAQPVSPVKPKTAAPAHNLPVAAPPIIANANDELGIKAPQAINTAQLEQVNAARKPSAEPTAKPEPKPVPRTETKVAALEPVESKPRRPEPRSEPRSEPRPEPRREPRVVERREPERSRPEPRPEPRQERRAAPSPPPRVVERPAPRPAVRVVEAPRAPVARVRPQQVTVVRSDNWRVRVFESR